MAASDGKVRVLIVDDIAETRENIRKLLQFENDMEVVGVAGTGRAGIDVAQAGFGSGARGRSAVIRENHP